MRPPRRRNLLRNLLVVLVFALVGAIPLYELAGADHPAPVLPPDAQGPSDGPKVFFEPVSGAVLHAKIDAFLVQAGTDKPFNGDGLPGIRLVVRSNSDLSKWTVEGWANQTVVTGTTACTKDTVRYLRYDWVVQIDDTTGQGIFSTTASTVPQRVLPDGDQCSLRKGAVGEWNFTYCVEPEEGGPRGVTRDKEGNKWVDDWDVCKPQTVQVKA